MRYYLPWVPPVVQLDGIRGLMANAIASPYNPLHPTILPNAQWIAVAVNR